MKLNKVLFKFIKIAFSTLMLLLIVYATAKIGTTAYEFGYRVFTEPAVEEAPGTDILVQIKDETKQKEVGTLLEEKGLVRDGQLFYLQYRLSAYWKKGLTPGVYTLNTSMTAKEMMIVLCPEPKEDTETESQAASSETSTENSTEGTEGTENGSETAQ